MPVVAKAFLGEAPAGLAADEAAVEVQLVGQGAVFVGRGDDGDVFEVFGGGADEGGTPMSMFSMISAKRASDWRRPSQRHRG